MLQAHLSKHAHLCVEKWKAETLWEIQNLLLIFFLPINSEGLEYKNGSGKEHVCAGQPQLGEVSGRVWPLQGFLKALSTATAKPKRRVCLQAFLTRGCLSHSRGKARPGALSTHSRSFWMLLGPQVALKFLPAYYYALPTDSVLQQI